MSVLFQNEVLITQMLVDQDYDIDSTIAMVLHLDPSPDFSDSAGELQLDFVSYKREILNLKNCKFVEVLS